MIPKERLDQSEAKIAELERALADSVPRATLEELQDKIASMMKDATAGGEEPAAKDQ
jgi:hypothetical protein